MARAAYRSNGVDRCYHCKAELMDVLAPIAAAEDATVVLGVNVDDLGDHRPGQRAAAEAGAAFPLVTAGLVKAEVRSASRRLGLRTWDKPAAACLASRVAYGVPVSAERLARVEDAEQSLRTALTDAGLGVRNLRVRDLGPVDGAETARVEVDAVRVADLTERPDLLAAVRGYDRVEVDPRGFRSGSMNELLPDPVRYR
jgi:uncharacterized protein